MKTSTFSIIIKAAQKKYF